MSFRSRQNAASSPGRLADVPFDRMHAEGAVGDVRDAEVLAARQQVLDAHRDHRAERDLERPAAEVEVAGAADARDADRSGSSRCRPSRSNSSGPSGRSGCAMCCSSTVNSARKPPRLPHVGRRREPVGRAADDVAAQPQPGVADAAVRARRLGLQPVEQAEAELPRAIEVASALGRVDADDGAEPVVVLRPVHDGDVARARSRSRSSCGRGSGGIATTDDRPSASNRIARQRLVRLGADRRPAQQTARASPGARRSRQQLVLARLVDRVVLAGQVLDREADA